MVRFGARVLWIKALGIAYLPLTFTGGHEDLCAFFGFLNDIPCFVFFSLLWHAVFNKLLNVFVGFIICVDNFWKFLLQLNSLFHFACFNQQ